MTETPDDPLNEADGEAAADAFNLPPAGVNWIGQALTALGVLIVCLVVLILGARLAVLTDPGRQMFVAFLDGQPLGPIGKLRVKGLTGDLFGRFQPACRSRTRPAFGSTSRILTSTGRRRSWRCDACTCIAWAQAWCP